jgi:Mechanosensitive ion channel, beta-domain
VSPLVSRSENILQNFLAGILLLLQEPFQLGDLISVTGIEGNVHDIQARATVITTKEGRPIVIPKPSCLRARRGGVNSSEPLTNFSAAGYPADKCDASQREAEANCF